MDKTWGRFDTFKWVWTCGLKVGTVATYRCCHWGTESWGDSDDAKPDVARNRTSIYFDVLIPLPKWYWISAMAFSKSMKCHWWRWRTLFVQPRPEVFATASQRCRARMICSQNFIAWSARLQEAQFLVVKACKSIWFLVRSQLNISPQISQDLPSLFGTHCRYPSLCPPSHVWWTPRCCSSMATRSSSSCHWPRLWRFPFQPGKSNLSVFCIVTLRKTNTKLSKITMFQ